MTDSLEQKGVQEIKDSKYCIYLLTNEAAFSQGAYKILMAQKGANLLKAAKIRHNGHTELIYLTQGYENYPTIINSLTREHIFVIWAKVLEAVLRVKDQGFLAVENLDISPERLYFDTKTFETYLVYLPLAAGDSESEINFDRQLRALLIRFIHEADLAASEREQLLIHELTSGRKSFEEILKILNSGTHKNEDQNNWGGKKQLRLVGIENAADLNFVMTENEMTIGRRKENDVVLDFSRQISRQHCTIYRQGEIFLIRDEDSKYGTRLNGKRLPAGLPMQISDGDLLALPLPGIGFKVEIV